LNRIAGVDFRLPTDAELDAIEAFMLSLGRSSDPVLSTLVLNDADADTGLALFNSPLGGKCFFCHFNAGANQGIFPPPLQGQGNANFNTGVETAQHPADALGLPRPRDGGFGAQVGDCPPDGCGNKTFNTPPLVEAADKRAFFHNNLCTTIECAVEFYISAAFNGSPSGVLLASFPPFLPLSLSQLEINQIAAFLRVINALENIRAAEAKLTNALQETIQLPQLKKTFRLASADIKDAIRVLRESPLNVSGLHPTAQSWLDDAYEYCDMAQTSRSKTQRYYRVNAALEALKEARCDLRNTVDCN
jgi:hypothetical protein